jgi:hypothetical protein
MKMSGRSVDDLLRVSKKLFSFDVALNQWVGCFLFSEHTRKALESFNRAL